MGGTKYGPGYVYFLNSRGTDKYKIGLTIDLDRRLKELNSGQAPDPVDMLWNIKVSNMGLVESELHKTFDHKNHFGEWFNFSEYELDEVKSAYEELRSRYPYRTEKPIKMVRQTDLIKCISQGAQPNRSDSSWFGALFWLGLLLAGCSILFGGGNPVESSSVVTKNSKVTLEVRRTVTIDAGPNYRGANLRDAPNGSNIVDMLPNGSKVKVLGQKDGWYRVEGGWVWKELVR